MKPFEATMATFFALAACCMPAGSQSRPPQIRADSLIRLADSVSFAAVISGSLEIQYSMKCEGTGFQLLYMSLPARLYPAGKALYSKPEGMPANVVERYRSLPALVAACDRKPDLRVISKSRGDGLQIFVDTTSIGTVVDGLRRVWAGFDYASLAYDPPYNAPYGQKRELLEFDCKRNTYRVIAGYDLDSGDTVTDGMLAPEGKLQLLEGESMNDYVLVQDAICGERQDWSGRPPLPVRDKVAPAALRTIPDIPVQVAASINALKLPAVSRSLRGIKTTGTSSYQGKSEPFEQSFLIRPSGTPGTFEVELSGKGYKTRKLEFLGMIELAALTDFEISGSQSWTVATQLKLDGDWTAMPVGSELKYKLAWTNTSSDLGVRTYERDKTCRISKVLSANTLHVQLVGVARELRCQSANDQHQRVDTYYFLMDYGFAFRQGSSPNAFYFSHEKIDHIDQ